MLNTSLSRIARAALVALAAALPVQHLAAQVALDPADLKAPRDFRPAETRGVGTLFSDQQLELLGLNKTMPISAASLEKVKQVDTVASLLRDALSYSLEYRASGESRDAARLSAEAALRGRLPRVDLAMSGGLNRYRTTTQPNTDALKRGDASITLRQPIWDMSQAADRRRKLILQEAADHDADAASLKVTSELVSAYLEVVRNRAVVDISNDYERTLARLIDYLRKRAAAGASSQADLDRVKGREEGAKARALEARAGMAAASLALKRQVGRVPEAISLPVNHDLALPDDADGAFDEAAANSPALRSGRAQIDALEQERLAVKARFQPRVELEVSNAQTRNASGSPGRTNDLKAMVNVTMNLFSAGGDQIELDAASMRRSALVSRTMHAERVLRQDIEIAYSAMEAIQQRLEPTVAELAATARVAKTYDDQLLIGGRNLLDLLDAYQRLYEARLGLLNLVVADAQQKYTVVSLLGRLRQLQGE